MEGTKEMAEELLQDFPAGPLDRYRKQASFDWKKMRVFMEEDELLAMKVRQINV